jgi:hypothetical protein
MVCSRIRSYLFSHKAKALNLIKKVAAIGFEPTTKDEGAEPESCLFLEININCFVL